MKPTFTNTPGQIDASDEGRVSAPLHGMSWVIGLVFFSLAGWFVFGPDLLDLPVKNIVSIDPAQLSTEPRRQILHDPPTIHIGGFDRTCMDCHKTFPPRDDPPKVLAQHQNIVLNHGINKQCRNCHDTEDRDLLVLRGGETIGYNDVVTLCAKCHGPAYRDWQHGSHGRTNGYWDASRGVVRRVQCTECHDPHNPRVPAMDPMAPLPGPDTLRMRPVGVSHHEDPSAVVEHRDPLRRAIHQFNAQERANSDLETQEQDTDEPDANEPDANEVDAE